jgi:hypothetical protein
MVKRAAGPLRQPRRFHVAGVGMHAALAEHHQRPPIERKRHRDRVGPIGGVGHVIDDFQSVRFLHRADAPAAEVVAVAVEHHHRRILALKHIDTILRIGRHAADHAKGLALGHLGPVADQFVGIVAAAEFCHVRCSVLGRMKDEG